jgi:hypothetical protein
MAKHSSADSHHQPAMPLHQDREGPCVALMEKAPQQLTIRLSLKLLRAEQPAKLPHQRE